MVDTRGETSNLLAISTPNDQAVAAPSGAPHRSGERIARAINECREHKREIFKLAETEGFEPSVAFWTTLI